MYPIIISSNVWSPQVTARLGSGLAGFSGELSPKSLNGLRGNVHTIFARAIERGVWQGQNPAKAVKRRKVRGRSGRERKHLTSLYILQRPLYALLKQNQLKKS